MNMVAEPMFGRVQMNTYEGRGSFVCVFEFERRDRTMWCVRNIWRVKLKISRNCVWLDFEAMRER